MVAAFTTGTIILVATTLMWLAAVIIREAGRSAWGRQFDKEADAHVRGGAWIAADSTTRALSLELIRRSDAMTATHQDVIAEFLA